MCYGVRMGYSRRKVIPLNPEQQKLAAGWLPLMRKLVSQAAQGRTEYEDLLGPSTEALLRAARAFKPGAGWTFQALATRCVKNAIIDVRRRKRNEVELKDWHVEAGVEVAPPRPQRALLEQLAAPAPNPQQLARTAAVTALHSGSSYRQARAAAARHLARPPSLDTVHRWAKAEGVEPRRRGRPAKVGALHAARWLRDGSVAQAQEASGLSRRTLSRCAKMFGGVSRLRRIFSHARSDQAHGKHADHQPTPARSSHPAWG